MGFNITISIPAFLIWPLSSEYLVYLLPFRNKKKNIKRGKKERKQKERKGRRETFTEVLKTQKKKNIFYKLSLFQTPEKWRRPWKASLSNSEQTYPCRFVSLCDNM